jgi:hypothetical protein
MRTPAQHQIDTNKYLDKGEGTYKVSEIAVGMGRRERRGLWQDISVLVVVRQSIPPHMRTQL